MLDEKAAGGLSKVEAADILIHPNGKYLYASVRGPNTIAVLNVGEAGEVSLRENIDCSGLIRVVSTFLLTRAFCSRPT